MRVSATERGFEVTLRKVVVLPSHMRVSATVILDADQGQEELSYPLI